jgi:ADP-ribose pyrophosphatase YjhB (NUDIX family)/O-acetyl-ADP-ribose deacetylase (regulator of RNase III)
MKIKNTEIEITQGDISKVSVDVVVNPLKSSQDKTFAKHVLNVSPARPNGKVDQHSLRDAVSLIFEKTMKLKANSIALPTLGCESDLFPKIGAAKIIAQEILKIARYSQNPPRRIVICAADMASFKVFDTTVRGYLTHIQDDLGQGPYVTVDIIIELPEGIILIERSNPPYGWALPGGFVDYGESLEIAVRREAKEETNMELDNLRQFHTYSDPARDPRFHTISTVFIAQGKGQPQFGDDAKGLKVVPYDELLKREYAFDHKQVIVDYLASRKK